MPSGKLEQQLKVKERAEYKVGKIEQQKGIKPTIAYKQKERKYKEAISKQQRLKKEIETFQNKKLTYSNYRMEYNKLSLEAKKYVTPPAEVEKSEGYKQYTSYQKQKQEYETKQAALTKAREIYMSRSPYAVFTLPYQSDLVRKYYKEIARDSDYSISKAAAEKEVAEISENLMTTREGIVDVRTGEIVAPVGISPTFAAEFAKQKIQETPDFLIKPTTSYVDKEYFEPVSYVTEVEKPKGFLEGISAGISKRRMSYETKSLMGREVSLKERGTQFGLSVLTPFVETGIFAKQLVTHPIETPKKVGKAVFSLGKKVVSGEGVPEVGVWLKTSSPESLVGRGVGEAVLLKGTTLIPKTITKGTDIFRTRKLIEVEKEAVIAPEFFAGQKFPSIKKGQTAGKLLGEFKPLEQYGVTSLRGFTAAPKPFKKTTEALKGGSELPGIYQAPKISPHFLRVGGETEQKLFSWKVFDTFRPSVMQTTPTSFELVKGVSPSQKEMFARSKAKKFFIEKAEKGKSYVPFIKTEKEAIIPLGTPLKKTGARFYFKFEGRKIPILEYETATLKKKKKLFLLPSKEFKTIEEISASSSSRKIGTTAKYSPVSFVSPSRISYKPSKPSSSFLSSSARKKISSSSIRTSPSRAYSYLGKPSYKRTPPTRAYSYLGKPSSYRPPVISPPRSYGRTLPTRIPPARVYYPKEKKEFKRTYLKKFEKRKPILIYRKPSLVALGVNIKTPKIAKGETAFSIRPIITKKKRRK